MFDVRALQRIKDKLFTIVVFHSSLKSFYRLQQLLRVKFCHLSSWLKDVLW